MALSFSSYNLKPIRGRGELRLFKVPRISLGPSQDRIQGVGPGFVFRTQCTLDHPTISSGRGLDILAPSYFAGYGRTEFKRGIRQAGNKCSWRKGGHNRRTFFGKSSGMLSKVDSEQTPFYLFRLLGSMNLGFLSSCTDTESRVDSIAT